MTPTTDLPNVCPLWTGPVDMLIGDCPIDVERCERSRGCPWFGEVAT